MFCNIVIILVFIAIQTLTATSFTIRFQAAHQTLWCRLMAQIRTAKYKLVCFPFFVEFSPLSLRIGNALSVFNIYNNSYIPGNIEAYYRGVSLVGCAAICARDPTCLSFESGYAGREGDCFTSRVNQNSSGIVFRQNSFGPTILLSFV